uniref:NADH dehydrogenase subunit 4L n=1 Tax=Lamprotula gottschei TaxID=1470580 RepID=A0A1U8V3C3_9BIVA|nr:NADH dehydrogenase subunit 4L [Lamprotula gottschei]
MTYGEVLNQNLCFFYLFVISLCCVLLQRHSLFGILVSLEVVSLVICFNFVCGFEHTGWVGSFVLVFLCFEVCIMCILLCLMIMFIKGVGHDYVSVLVFSYDF